jgi:xanthine dehydrogenase YagS FAD-binding subunit
MKAFKLVSPRNLDEALAALPKGRDPKAREKTRVLAGGQDLLTELKEHLAEPDVLVNLKGVGELGGIEQGPDGALAIGALTTLTDLAEHPFVREHLAVLAEAAESIASPQIRSQATVGGNLCQRPRCWYYRLEAAPCIKKGGAECFSYSGQNKYNAILGGGPSYIVHPSDLAPALIALDAEVELASPRGRRRMPLERFFTLPSEGSILRENVLEQDELVVAVHVPPQPAGLRSHYLKFKERESYDFALVSVALAVVKDGAKLGHVRLVLGGVAPIPWRAPEAEALLTGKESTPASWLAAAEEALFLAEPLEHNAFKIPLTKGLIRRAFEALG